MRAIWRGEPPFEGADPVGPAPVQAGGPKIYAGVMGPKATARGMASMMDRASPDAVRASLDDLEAAGCDEVFLVPATAELAEVERAAEIVAKR